MTSTLYLPPFSEIKMSAVVLPSEVKILLFVAIVCCIYVVRAEECLGGPNEEFNKCGSACPRTCDNHWKDLPCDLPCSAGCFCKPGYVRNVLSNYCVLTEDCPRKDANDEYQCYGLNKEFQSCGSACPATCADRLSLKTCPWPCGPSCGCKEGHLRDNLNHCVPPVECQRKLGECLKSHEEFQECGSGCPKTCENYNRHTICKAGCQPGCFCAKGYVRDYNGDCVLPKNCPPKGAPPCGSQEIYKQCGSACAPTCNNYGTSVYCSRKCVPGCYCKKGLVKDDYGACIRPQFCRNPYLLLDMRVRSCLDKNEILGYGTACEPSCKDYMEHKDCDAVEVFGCFCREGYVRDNFYYDCIRPEQCPKEKLQCEGNLERVARLDRWHELTCESPQEYQKPPRGRCPCKPGYLRDGHKECVDPELCPVACPGLHETYDCGSPCDVTCDNLSKVTPCKVFSYDCVKRCYCKKGYVRDHRNACIKAHKCPERCYLPIPFGKDAPKNTKKQ